MVYLILIHGQSIKHNLKVYLKSVKKLFNFPGEPKEQNQIPMQLQTVQF